MKKIIAASMVFLLIWAAQGLSDTSGRQRPGWSQIYCKTTDIARGWKYIVIHHSATKAGSAAAFHRHHTEQGYGGLCYHFVIGNGSGTPDGMIEEGFRWKEQMAGTHVDINSWYHNIFGIGICLVGNLEKNPPTHAQVEALSGLLKELTEKYDIPKDNILFHRQVPHGDMTWDVEKIRVSYKAGQTARTNCPGKFCPGPQELLP